MKAFFTGDIHLTGRPKDAYRFEIFDWIARQKSKRDFERIYILGDLTDEKDFHPSKLVNKTVDHLVQLQERTGAEIVLLKGNHDFLDPECPFMGFLKHVPGIQYVTHPATLDAGRTLLLPYSQDPNEEWGLPINARLQIDAEKVELVLCHQTFNGAVVSNGFTLPGPSSLELQKEYPNAKIVSGDIHVPQKCGAAYYCGSPHPVHFGDDFQPRMIYWNDDKLTSVKVKGGLKRVVIDLDGTVAAEPVLFTELSAGDQVRVRVHLRRADFGEYDGIRKEVVGVAEEGGYDLHSVSLVEDGAEKRKRVKLEEAAPTSANDGEILKEFSQARKLEKVVVDAGALIVGEA